jgi:hypothetical protein
MERVGQGKSEATVRELDGLKPLSNPLEPEQKQIPFEDDNQKSKGKRGWPIHRVLCDEWGEGDSVLRSWRVPTHADDETVVMNGPPSAVVSRWAQRNPWLKGAGKVRLPTAQQVPSTSLGTGSSTAHHGSAAMLRSG